ncbi:MAG: DUF5131 family protein [Clostridia bacterium]
MAKWNPWHGCKKYSAGCENCYIYRIDSAHGKNASVVFKTGDFLLPIQRKRNGEYKIKSGEFVFTCFSSDFLLDTADEWRSEAWAMMRMRSDIEFFFITKRIVRLASQLPDDWGLGYGNVHISVTAENQHETEIRLPIFNDLPIANKYIVCEPLLSPIDLTPYLNSEIINVSVGGESGEFARPVNYDWILDIRRQCETAHVNFIFRQTGARFIKDGKLFNIPRKYQHSQAKKACIDLIF